MMKLRRVGLVVCVFALAVPAATAGTPKPPAFHVTIQATMDEVRNFIDVGCTERVTRHLDIKNAAPVTLTASQLGHAKSNLFALVATETRSIAFSLSGPHACDNAPNGAQSGACGTVTYTIDSAGTGVGFLNSRTDEFGFGYTRIGTDPYLGKCGLIEGRGSASQDHYPASGVGVVANSVVVNRNKLTAHKRFVVTYSGSGQWSDGTQANGSPQPLSQVTVSWQVTLVPIS
jgi:hypothetical protein